MNRELSVKYWNIEDLYMVVANINGPMHRVEILGSSDHQRVESLPLEEVKVTVGMEEFFKALARRGSAMMR